MLFLYSFSQRSFINLEIYIYLNQSLGSVLHFSSFVLDYTVRQLDNYIIAGESMYI